MSSPDRESTLRERLPHGLVRAVWLLSIALAGFHLYTAFAGPLLDIRQRSIHLYALLALAFVLYPRRQGRARSEGLPLTDLLAAALVAGIGVYLCLAAPRIIATGGFINDTDLAVGIAAVLLLLEGARRVSGPGMPLLCLAFIAYALWAKLSVYASPGWPVVLANLRAIFAHLVFLTEGVLGTAVAVSASYIMLFILFGAFLNRSGMGRLFNDIALGIAGGSRGGPAKVAVIASGFLGSINGSAVANVVTTGAFTIPLMKRSGYRAEFAAAVEAAASVGGQILPPVMGAAAFIMAETLSLPYTQIMLAGVIPALLYYTGILVQAHLRAVRRDLRGMPRSELPPLPRVLRLRGHLLMPIAVLLALLFLGRAPFYAGACAIAACVLVSGNGRTLLWAVPLVLLALHGDSLAGRPPQAADGWMTLVALLCIAINRLRGGLDAETPRLSTRDCADALADGVRTAVPVAIACGAVGLIVGVSTLTGAALELASLVIQLGQVIASPTLQLLLTLTLTMLCSIVLGMGLPSIPTYIITSTMAAPILLNLPLFRELAGSTESAVFVAHMFVFYFGIFANITPPVALAAYAGAGISGGNPHATGAQALRLALAGFIVPFMFVFAPALLMIDASPLQLLGIAASALLGVGLLGIATEGWLLASLNRIERLAAFAAALTLISPGWVSDLAGVAVAATLAIRQYRQRASS